MEIIGLTEIEQRYTEAVEEHGSIRKAAAALGVSKSNVHAALQRAARRGYAPGHFEDGTAPGYVMGKVTVQRDSAGNVERTWERQSPDQSRMAEFMQATADGLKAELPRAKPVKAPAKTEAALCNLYTLTDCHVGMLAWHKEGGADWDLKIAEDTLTRCFERIVEASPSAKTAVVCNLGDFQHFDGLEAVTPAHKHLLDADGRFGKMVSASIRILRRIINHALLKHEIVHVMVCEGNHDIASSVWLRHMFTALYENEPRVTVCDSELPYYTVQHGKTMLAFHHGHLSKNGSLPLLFASQYPEMWGATTKRYAHTGHRHHVEIKEHAGMTVCQHSTLAARDAYAARGGWFSERQITSYTYHKDHGQVGSATVVPEMVG
jgi:hypothetical protein